MKQVEKQHYHHGYDTKGRFASYWHQIDEILALHPSSILDIGIGNGFVADYLRQERLNLTTADIDPDLKPDLVCSVTRLPFSNETFSLASCFQVLEHLEYRQFTESLLELKRVVRDHVLLSLPDRSLHLSLGLKLYPFFSRSVSFSISRHPKAKFRFDGEHYWEIGYRGTGLGQIKKSIGETGLQIVRTYRVLEKPLHRIFLLQKRLGS
jgi:SAM-dependent methyltransferase